MTMPLNSNHQQPPPPKSSFKKLQRLPHVFSKVLELPFTSNVNVYVQEQPHCFKFFAELDHDDHDHDHDVKAHIVEIHPGIIKVLIRMGENLDFSTIDEELDADLWRFRLPPSTRPERATVVGVHGQIVVTVPKNGWDENFEREFLLLYSNLMYWR